MVSILAHTMNSVGRGTGRLCLCSRDVRVRAVRPKTDSKKEVISNNSLIKEFEGVGDVLGPIGQTYGAPVKEREREERGKESLADKAGLSLGPISLSFSEDSHSRTSAIPLDASECSTIPSIHTMTTEEWRKQYEPSGAVDLWVEEEFNSGSRLVGGRDVYKGGLYGIGTGEGPSRGEVATHKVVIHNHYVEQVVEVEVPEDRYILWEAEEEGLQLPYACRMGCCTACAVKVKEGEMFQPEALGISEELKQQGYALMCVGFPLTDLVLETVPEDEVYDLQFGGVFDQLAMDPDGAYVERDDIALEIANMDE